jgi:error-prone DNA polymerase
MGIAVLPPDVNRSGRHWTGRSAEGAGAVRDGAWNGGGAEDGAPPAGVHAAERAAGAPPAPRAAGRGWVRAGLLEIRGLREETAEAILAEREKRGPFASFDDLLRRAPVDPADARRLIRAGACDAFGSRPRLHWRVQEWEARGEGRRRGTPSLFPPEPGPLPDPRPHDAAKLLRDEEEALGMLLSRHPLTLYRGALLSLRRAGVRPVRGSEMGRHVRERVTMVGWLVTGKLVTTKDDEPMEFVSFEDTTAIYETTFFPRAYERFCGMLTTARPYLLRGRVEEDFGAVTLTVEEARFLDGDAGRGRDAERGRGAARAAPAGRDIAPAGRGVAPISRGGAAGAAPAAPPGSPRP